MRYDFSHDPSFEAGIAAILEKHGEGKEREDAVEKAKAWYYNRSVFCNSSSLEYRGLIAIKLASFIQPMDYAEFAAWKARRESGEPEEELDDAAPVSTAAAVSSTAAPAADAQDGQTEGEKTEETEQAAAATDASAASEPRYPASFMELCQMLAEGKPIPGQSPASAVRPFLIDSASSSRHPRNSQQDQRGDAQ